MVEEFRVTNENIEIEQLRPVVGQQIWINLHDEERIEKCFSSRSKNDFEKHFDVQIQVENGQFEPVVRYEVFPSKFEKFSGNKNDDFREPTETENGENRKSSNRRDDSSKSNENHRRNDERPDRRSTGNQQNSSSDGADGFDPRKPDDENEDETENEDEEETDEALARRMAFRPIDNETIRVIGRIRSLTKKKSTNLEILSDFIDDLIRFQRLELFPDDQLEKVVFSLRIDRVFGSKVRALSFVRSRLPVRSTSRGQTQNNGSVFELWRERERRARADSKDSLEEENFTGRDQNYFSSNQNFVKSKVRQMAKDIDTRTVLTRPVDSQRSSSPINENFQQITTETFQSSTGGLTTDEHRVRKIIDRLESSSSTNEPQKNNFRTKFLINEKNEEKFSSPVDFHRVETENSSKITDVKLNPKDEDEEEEETFMFHHRGPNEEIFIRQRNPSGTARLQVDSQDLIPNDFRTTTGKTVEEFLSSLLPESQTTISMVRDVRTRLYEDELLNNSANFDVEIPMKVDVETLYILEQRETKKPSVDFVRPTIFDRQDFAGQTLICGNSDVKPDHRPVGTQVESTIEQQTTSVQTTDSLHWPNRERQSLTSLINTEDDQEKSQITTTTVTRRYEVKRRHSSHYSSEDEQDSQPTKITIEIDEKNNVEIKPNIIIDESMPTVPESKSSFGHVSSRIRMDQLRELNRQIVERHADHQEVFLENQHRSNEVYEIHTRGACKCLVVSAEEQTQIGSETRFENQLKRIERTYTENEIQSIEIHVLVANSDKNFQLVRRDYGPNRIDQNDRSKTAVNIHYYNRDGQRMSTEYHRPLENLPLFIRCEIEYELNHYRSAKLIILSFTAADRRQMNVALKKDIVEEIVAHTAGRLAPNSPQLEAEINRHMVKTVPVAHLTDYSSRDNINQTNSNDIRRISRLDVMNSLRLVQRHRNVIHRLCHLFRSHLNLTVQAEKQRHLILVSRDEYYLFDLGLNTNQSSTRTIIHEKPKEIIHIPFDYVKYRREAEEQRQILERYQNEHRQTRQAHQGVPPPPGDPNEAEFYLGSGRRALIEKEIHSMRASIRPHEQAQPIYKHEPRRRTLSIGYTGAQRYVRARIIHVKDYYDENQPRQQYNHKNAKEQELFVRVDDYVNEAAANSLRRSYSTDYLLEDGPRTRIRYIRIPGETIRIEEKNTYEYQGVMYANLPYSLRYWNILQLLDRDTREGRQVGATLPKIIVNDPYQTVIPPLTQKEIRETAQHILSPSYNVRSTTDQTLRWFLSRDNRTEIESSKYLQALNQRLQQQQLANKRTDIRVEGGQQRGTKKKYFVTESLVRYEKLPDRLVPVVVPDRSKSIDNIHQQSKISQKNIQNQGNNVDRQSANQRFTIFQPSFPGATTKPLSRHQSVHELSIPAHLSHPPSPSPSLHSLHNQKFQQQQQQQFAQQQRRPINQNFRPQNRIYSQSQNPLLTEIIDSQTGRRILTTSQEQLPREVLGLLNKYNLQHF